MPDDLSKKQEKPFSNKNFEEKKETFKPKIEIPQTKEQSEIIKEKVKEDNKGKEKLKEGELGQGSIASLSAQKKIRDEQEKEIGRILENDMDDIYLRASPEKRKEFKIKGEKTARQINEMINNGKLKFKKLIDLIKKWLLIIPGINKFFLEQEAKLKTDEIIKMANKK